jgi:predicted nucleic acid-binding protein
VKFALDTNVFVEAFRDEAFAAGSSAFLEGTLPTTFLGAVVMQELTAGARTSEQVRELDAAVFAAFERRGRVFAPSAEALRESGRLLAELAQREGWEAPVECVSRQRHAPRRLMPRARHHVDHERS